MTNKETVLFCGNFVKDNIIHYNKSKNETVSQTCSLGGSVTFGSLAFSHYVQGEHLFDVRVVSNVDGSLLNPSERELVNSMFLSPSREDSTQVSLPPSVESLRHENHSLAQQNDACYLTSYNLLYNDENIMTNERTLTLHCKGPSMNDPQWLLQQCKTKPLPSAIFFVPVAAEFDELAVAHVMDNINKLYESSPSERYPLVCCDIQGFLRTFEPPEDDSSSGLSVTSHPSVVMKEKLKILGEHVFLLKADLNEANAVLRDDQSSELVLSPYECAKRMHKLFGFKVVCVTMGPQGCLVSCKANNHQVFIRGSHDHIAEDNKEEVISEYINAYQPKHTVDETGCGDTFLACLVAELLFALNTNQSTGSEQKRDYLHTEQLFNAVRMSCAATSYVVECYGPHGFSSRQMATKRVQEGHIIKSGIEMK